MRSQALSDCTSYALDRVRKERRRILAGWFGRWSVVRHQSNTYLRSEVCVVIA
jgi:hypothetical protein